MLSCLEQRRFSELKETAENLALQGRLKDAYVASVLLYSGDRTDSNYELCVKRWDAMMKSTKPKTKDELGSVATIDPLPLSSLEGLSMAVVGHQVAKDRLWGSFIFPLFHPNVWGSPNRNLLLFGPPGTGKTHLVKSMLAELSKAVKLRIYAPKPAELRGKYVGENEKKLEDLWTVAAGSEKDPTLSIIFIDEIDDLLKKGRESDLVVASSVNTFLQLTGGIKKFRNVFVIGTTNHPDWMDPAVLRRMPHRIYVDFPSKEDIVDLLEREYRKIGSKFLGEKEYRQRFACKAGQEIKTEEEEEPLGDIGDIGASAWDKVKGSIPSFAQELWAASFSQDEVIQIFNNARRRYAEVKLLQKFSSRLGYLVPGVPSDMDEIVRIETETCKDISFTGYDISLLTSIVEEFEGFRIWRVEPIGTEPEVWLAEVHNKIFQLSVRPKPGGLSLSADEKFLTHLGKKIPLSKEYSLSCSTRWYLNNDVVGNVTRVILPELPFEYLKAASKLAKPATERNSETVKKLKLFEQQVAPT